MLVVRVGDGVWAGLGPRLQRTQAELRSILKFGPAGAGCLCHPRPESGTRSQQAQGTETGLRRADAACLRRCRPPQVSVGHVDQPGGHSIHISSTEAGPAGSALPPLVQAGGRRNVYHRSDIPLRRGWHEYT